MAQIVEYFLFQRSVGQCNYVMQILRTLTSDQCKHTSLDFQWQFLHDFMVIQEPLPRDDIVDFQEWQRIHGEPDSDPPVEPNPHCDQGSAKIFSNAFLFLGTNRTLYFWGMATKLVGSELPRMGCQSAVSWGSMRKLFRVRMKTKYSSRLASREPAHMR